MKTQFTAPGAVRSRTGSAGAAPNRTGQKKLKTPISYYGGKQMMLRHILPLIPEHKIYVEPFFGGGAVFFAKTPAKVEIINDKLDQAINFYQIARDRFPELLHMVQNTLHAESTYQKAKAIFRDQTDDPVTNAWAFWVLSAMGFAHVIGHGFAFGKDQIANTTANRIERFTEEIQQRLRHCQIFSRDAIDVIRRFDSPDTFFYFDPPYSNSNCGHYAKEKDVYFRLLEILPQLSGKWLLSSYPTDELAAIRELPGIQTANIEKKICVTGKRKEPKLKIETLTWNYPVK